VAEEDLAAEAELPLPELCTDWEGLREPDTLSEAEPEALLLREATLGVEELEKLLLWVATLAVGEPEKLPLCVATLAEGELERH
jgi:hypothetical protein